MSTDTAPAPRPAETSRRGRAAAWVLLAVTAGVLACALLLGEREAPLADLREAVASGEVTEVRLTEVLAPDEMGWSAVTIRWDVGLGMDRATWVAQASSERQARQARRQGAYPVIVGDVADALAAGGREVRVVGTTTQLPSGPAVFGTTVAPWLFWTWLAAVLATLVLVGDRDTWRATPWAWRWLVLLTPVGAPAYLLLGGPTGLLAPAPGARRLTGGWSFLVAVVVLPALLT